ncbi:hypothetical protein Tco_1433356 [Tanacetum coccineum]
MTPRFSEAFRRWRSTPLSTPYPPKTSESSSDSSSERPLDLSSLSAEVQRFKPEDSKEEHMEIGTVDAEAVTDLGIGDGVDTKDGKEASAGGTIEIDVDPLVTGGNSESTIGDVLDLEEIVGGWVDSLCHHMALSQEEFCQIHRDRDDAQRRLRRLESFVERRLGFRP